MKSRARTIDLKVASAAMKSYVRISGQDIPIRTGRVGDVSLVYTNGRR